MAAFLSPKTNLAFMTMPTYLMTLAAVFLACGIALAQDDPRFRVVEQAKPGGCPGGTGLHLIKGGVLAKQKAFVDVVVYFQRYDGKWDRKSFSRQGSGELAMGVSSCDYTGNFYAFAAYSGDTGSIPDEKTVVAKHKERGDNLLFRITKKKQLSSGECPKGGGAWIEEGEVFTPKGEKVTITLFMQLNDGTWRKKDLKFTGSGLLPIGMKDCDLSGNVKSLVAAD